MISLKKKLYLYYNKKYYFFLIIILSLLFINISFSKEIHDTSIIELTKKLRCLTCQNQTIFESDADFSNQIKEIIINKKKEGKSIKEIQDLLVVRYGEYILLEPKFDKKNIILWVLPFIIIFTSIILLYFKANNRKR